MRPKLLATTIQDTNKKGLSEESPDKAPAGLVLPQLPVPAVFSHSLASPLRGDIRKYRENLTVNQVIIQIRRTGLPFGFRQVQPGVERGTNTGVFQQNYELTPGQVVRTRQSSPCHILPNTVSLPDLSAGWQTTIHSAIVRYCLAAVSKWGQLYRLRHCAWKESPRGVSCTFPVVENQRSRTSTGDHVWGRTSMPCVTL